MCPWCRQNHIYVYSMEHRQVVDIGGRSGYAITRYVTCPVFKMPVILAVAGGSAMTPNRRGAYEIPSWAIAQTVSASAHPGRLHLLERSQPQEGGVWRYFCTLEDCGYYTDSMTPDGEIACAAPDSQGKEK